MALSSLIALCVLCSVLSSAAGNCRNFAAKPDFNLDNYLDTWYYSWQSPSALSFKCSHSIYSRNGGVITIEKHSGSGDPQIGEAHAQAGNQGQLEVSFPPGTGTIWVIDTDYENYSGVVMCINPRPGVPSMEMAVIFSRDQNGPPASVLNGVKAKLAELGFDGLVKVDQEC